MSDDNEKDIGELKAKVEELRGDLATAKLVEQGLHKVLDERGVDRKRTTLHGKRTTLHGGSMFDATREVEMTLEERLRWLIDNIHAAARCSEDRARRATERLQRASAAVSAICTFVADEAAGDLA